MIDNKNNDPVLREKELDGYRSIAQKIRNRLMQLENASDKDKKRWIWELLQNAVDAANGQEVDIEIVLGENFVKFRHNGGVFTPRNVTNLVHQISSKEGTESIGRYGTGFLTTHTLSRIVEVEGVFIPSNVVNENAEGYYKFNLILNRNGSTERELVEGIASAWDSYKREEIEKPVKPFWTTFNYINSDIDIAKETIKDFETYVCYSLAFVKKIKSVTIVNEIENFTVNFNLLEINVINENLRTISFQKTVNEENFHINLFFAEANNVSLAIEIQNTEQGTYILPIKSNIPRIFCAYPLIGSEQFYFPYVINSTKFNPTQERDALYLKGETNQSKPNKELLLQATELYKIATNFATEQKWKDLYILAKHQLPPQSDEFDKDWYVQNIQKGIRKQLLTIPIVENPENKLMFIKQRNDKDLLAYFPFSAERKEREDIWKYFYDIYPQNPPKIEHIHEWYKILWKDCKKQTIEETISDVASFNTIEKLSERINRNKKETFKWLDSFVKFIEDNQPELLDKYAILPNQYGIFKLKKDLYEDADKVHKKLKDILKALGEDWYEEYLHLDITNAQMNGKVRWTNNLITLLNSIIDRNEFYMFNENSKNLFTNSIFPDILNNSEYNYLKTKLFNKKETYIKTIGSITKLDASSLATIEQRDARNQARKNIFEIVRLLPEKENITNYRTKMYQIAKEFDNEVPDITNIPKLPDNTWQKADIWILKYIISDIENFETIDKLSEHLNENISEDFDTEKTLEWLNDFFAFLFENEKLELLYEKEVYPDQNGKFHKKSELFQDIEIPEELKDVLEEFEKEEDSDAEIVGWRSMLLDKNITAFNEKHKLQPKTVKDISEKINEIIRNIEFSEAVEWRNIILKLLAYSNNLINEKQKKIWEFARTLYFDATPEHIEILPNCEEFDWSECFDWTINRIVIDIAESKFVEILQKEIHGSIKAIDWLDRIIDFLQNETEYKHLLESEEYPIIPNQSGDFCYKSQLYLDNEIPTELKEVIKTLNIEWYNELLEKKIYLELPENRVRDKKDAALEIDRIFKNYQGSKQEPIFVNAWSILSEYIEGKDEDYFRNNFDWIYRHKSELALATLGDEKQHRMFYKIITSGKIEIVSKIIEGNKFTDDELIVLSEDPDIIRDAINAKKTGKQTVSKETLLKELNKETGENFSSLDDFVKQYKQSKRKVGFAQEPTGEGGGYMDIDAIAKSNEEARDKLYKHLQKDKNYDISSWTKETNTIISGIKKNGIDIKIVVKGANNGIIYFDKAKKERKILSDTFAELWVHYQNEIFQITLGEVIKEWDVKGMKAYMFDFK